MLPLVHSSDWCLQTWQTRAHLINTDEEWRGTWCSAALNHHWRIKSFIPTEISQQSKTHTSTIWFWMFGHFISCDLKQDRFVWVVKHITCSKAFTFIINVTSELLNRTKPTCQSGSTSCYLSITSLAIHIHIYYPGHLQIKLGKGAICALKWLLLLFQAIAQLNLLGSKHMLLNFQYLCDLFY